MIANDDPTFAAIAGGLLSVDGELRSEPLPLPVTDELVTAGIWRP